jgi:hypothetical protein
MAFVVSGGGFRTMTAGFAFTRALTRAGFDWDGLTHLGGNSGGQWFGVQLIYGELGGRALLNDLQDTSKPLQQVMTDWAAAYSAVLNPTSHAMSTHANTSAETAAADTVPRTVNEQQLSHGICQQVTSKVFPAITEALAVGGLSVSPHITASNNILSATVPTIASLTYDAPRRVLPDVSFTQVLALAPDEYLDSTYEVRLEFDQPSHLSPIHPISVDSIQTVGLLLPAWHVQPGSHSVASGNASAVASGWHHPFATSMRLVSPSGAHHSVSFPPSSRTKISSVAAASSSAFAFGSSKTVFRNMLILIEAILLPFLARALAASNPFENLPWDALNPFNAAAEATTASAQREALAHALALSARMNASATAAAMGHGQRLDEVLQQRVHAEFLNRALEVARRAAEAAQHAAAEAARRAREAAEAALRAAQEQADRATAAAEELARSALATITSAIQAELDVTAQRVINYAADCMPFDADLGTPIDLEPTPPWASGSNAKPAYRAMDGAYVDNTALVPTIATMIHDCAAAHLDCNTTLPKLVLVNDDMGVGGSGSFHGAEGGISQFFGHSGSPPVGSGAGGPAFGTTVPSPRIFAEDYASLPWATYNDHSPVDLHDPSLLGAHTSRYMATAHTPSEPTPTPHGTRPCLVRTRRGSYTPRAHTQ